MSAEITKFVTDGNYSAEQNIPAGATRIEVWAVDADPATAGLACFLRLTDPTGDAAEFPVSAGQSYWTVLGPGVPQRWTYAIKAAVGVAYSVIS